MIWIQSPALFHRMLTLKQNCLGSRAHYLIFFPPFLVTYKWWHTYHKFLWVFFICLFWCSLDSVFYDKLENSVFYDEFKIEYIWMSSPRFNMLICKIFVVSLSIFAITY